MERTTQRPISSVEPFIVDMFIDKNVPFNCETNIFSIVRNCVAINLQGQATEEIKSFSSSDPIPIHDCVPIQITIHLLTLILKIFLL